MYLYINVSCLDSVKKVDAPTHWHFFQPYLPLHVFYLNSFTKLSTNLTTFVFLTSIIYR